MGLRGENGGLATIEVLSVSGCPPCDNVQWGGCSAEKEPACNRLAKTKKKKKKKKGKRRRRKIKEKIRKAKREKRDQGNQPKLKPPISAKITVHCDQ